VKTKQKQDTARASTVRKPQAPQKTRKTRKKFQFEDGVRAALIAAVVICTAVLGLGGFFIIRSILHGGDDSLPIAAVAESTPEAAPAPEPPVFPEETFPGEAFPPETYPQDSFSGTIPGLEQAISDLEAAGAGHDAAPALTETAPVPAAPPVKPDAATPPAAPAQLSTAVERKGIIVLVIDDAGNNLRELEPFLQFPGPITIAVLPGLANSIEAARRIRTSGKELFLHQPMEPLNGQDPGPGAIKTGMSPVEIKRIIIKNLNEIGPVSGFNNHEGSRATADPAIMRPVLEIVRDSALYFLDSRTTADTAAPQIAAQLGITIARRDVFLDNEQDRESMLAALEAGCKRAEQYGTAILIGHAWSPRLAALLTEMYPRIIKRGLVFSTVGTLLCRGK
jgi:polysaccharide deacetylase 2 family uncharacterized protein YibQ